MSTAGFLRSLLGFARPYRRSGWLVVAALALEMVVNALVPLSFKVLVDDVLPARDERLLLLLVAALVAGVVLMAVGGLARDWLYARLANRMLADIRSRVFAHLQKLSMDFYARTEAGQIIARFAF